MGPFRAHHYFAKSRAPAPFLGYLALVRRSPTESRMATSGMSSASAVGQLLQLPPASELVALAAEDGCGRHFEPLSGDALDLLAGVAGDLPHDVGPCVAKAAPPLGARDVAHVALDALPGAALLAGLLLLAPLSLDQTLAWPCTRSRLCHS